MFLKSLNLKGFKSFADNTTLFLEPGVTVVVGPNGSGKSNVVDAIAWVLGAQAPKAIRSQKMDDVIFAGTAKRPALGRAEVSLTIDNNAGTLGVDLSEITVTRILFRNGDSEYSINGVPCRLLDVQELLSDAGVGRQQHVIVSQGQIDAVLNARPEERRAIIEEAAGVLKFRRRKEKAERRLDATEANLLRVQDLLREVRRQLKPLERQAAAAERHGALVSELTAVKTYVVGREIASWRAKLESVAATRVDSASSETDVKSSLSRLDVEVMAIEAELTARGQSDMGDRMMRVEQLRERARGLAAILAERRRSLERDRVQLLDADLVASLEAEAARFRSELSGVADDLEAARPSVDELAADELVLAAEQERTLVVVAAIDEPPARAATAAAEVRGELRSVRAATDHVADELRRHEARVASLLERIARVQFAAERFRAECESASVIEEGLVDQMELAEVECGEASTIAEVRRSLRADAAEVASNATARVEALQLALDAAHARAGAERLAGVEGVLGTLLDLIEIDAGWAPAVEAALGESLTAVVVGDPGAGRRALEALRSSSTSGAVIALGTRSSAPDVPALGEAVRPHARSSEPGVAELLDGLLGAAVRLDDVRSAVDTALAHPEAVVVTGQGDRFGFSGWRIGAASAGATASALADAIATAAQSASLLADADAAAQAAVIAHAGARTRAERLARAIDDNDAVLTAAAEGLNRTQRELSEFQAEQSALAALVDDRRATIAREQLRIDELAALLPGLESDEQAEVEAARARSERRVEFDRRADALAARRTELEIRNAGLVQRQQLLARQLEETERRLDADVEARANAAGQRIEIERALVAIDELSVVVESRRVIVDDEHRELAESRRRQTDEVREMSVNLDRLRRERTGQEHALDAVRERARQAELAEAEARLRLEATVDMLRRELDIEPTVAEAAEVPVLPDGATPAGRLRELDRELRLLGPINPLALEEFNELQGRHTFLEEQLEDVRRTRRELSRVIAAVDEEIQRVFAAAFTDVADNFSALFTLLFPGGSGRLMLTTPDDMLNTGIEVEAKPGGKNIKKLSLLSGGERSLTALAFLFAVFRSRPSPFYVMDEVEAALDDVNLHRFLGLIDEFRKDAQLIVVSHQKRTMEAGDCLLGVTMEPGGSSKVITERMSTPSAV